MQFKRIKKLVLAIDVVLFSVSVVGVILFFVFLERPAWVGSVDDFVLSEYKKHYENKYFSAEAAAKSSRDAGLREWLSLAEDLNSISKGDRLSQMKKMVLLQISNLYLAAGNYQESAHYVDKWIEFDDKDFDAKIKKYHIMRSSSGLKEEAKTYLADLYERYPDVNSVVAQYKVYYRQ